MAPCTENHAFYDVFRVLGAANHAFHDVFSEFLAHELIYMLLMSVQRVQCVHSVLHRSDCTVCAMCAVCAVCAVSGRFYMHSPNYVLYVYA